MCHVFQHCGTNWRHCKLKFTQIKSNVSFLRSGENQSTRCKTGVPGGKPEYPGNNLSEQSREPTIPHMTPSLEIEPGAHWHEGNVLNTTLQEKKLLLSQAEANINVKEIHYK